MEVAFVSAGLKVIFAEMLEDLVDMFMVLFHVVQVDEDAYIKHIGEDVIHEVLEGCQCIS